MTFSEARLLVRTIKEQFDRAEITVQQFVENLNSIDLQSINDKSEIEVNYLKDYIAKLIADAQNV